MYVTIEYLAIVNSDISFRSIIFYITKYQIFGTSVANLLWQMYIDQWQMDKWKNNFKFVWSLSNILAMLIKGDFSTMLSIVCEYISWLVRGKAKTNTSYVPTKLRE